VPDEQEPLFRDAKKVAAVGRLNVKAGLGADRLDSGRCRLKSSLTYVQAAVSLQVDGSSQEHARHSLQTRLLKPLLLAVLEELLTLDRVGCDLVNDDKRCLPE
jgi:hypothetical protein